jgi:hypothetical protein
MATLLMSAFRRKLTNMVRTNNWSSYNYISQCFTLIKNWLITTDAAHEELVNMLNTHSVNPIPAYDMHGHLIHPLSYHSQLSGAVIELYFELSHWSMRGQNGEPSCDTFAADMVAIHVLVLPKPTLVTLHKCKVYDKMDPFASPSPSKKAWIMSLKLWSPYTSYYSLACRYYTLFIFHTYYYCLPTQSFPDTLTMEDRVVGHVRVQDERGMNMNV